MSRAVGKLAHHDEQVRCHSKQQHDAIQCAQLAVPGQRGDQYGRADHQRQVNTHQLASHPERDDQRRQPQCDQHVENIAADDAADRDVGAVGEGCLQSDGKLRRAAAEGDDCQTEEQRAGFEQRGEGHGSAYRQLRADDHQQQAAGELDQGRQGQIR